MHALSGHALIHGGEVAGYVYSVAEDRKGLIGDLFLRPGWRQTEGICRACWKRRWNRWRRRRGLRRVESQLMMVAPDEHLVIPMPARARSYSRGLLSARYGRRGAAAGEDGGRALRSLAGAVVGRRGAVDSDLLPGGMSIAILTTSTVRRPGARRFLHNIVQYPGCGTFFQPASHIATDEDGNLLGLCLASLVAHDVGHLTQICVGSGGAGVWAGL